MKPGKNRMMRALAYVMSTIMICQAFLSPVGTIYANVGDDSASQQAAAQVVDGNKGDGVSEEGVTADGAATTDNVADSSGDAASGSLDGAKAVDSAETSGQASAEDAGQATVAEQASGYNPDAEPIVIDTGVTVGFYKHKDENNQLSDPLTETDTVTSDQTLYGQVSITFNDSNRPRLENPNVSYKLPSNIEVPAQEMDLVDGGRVVGKTFIDDQGNVTLKYNEDYLQTTVTTASFKFSFTTAGDSKGDGDSEIVRFPGTTTSTTIHFRDGSVSGSKFGSNANNEGEMPRFDQSDNSYTWTVKVSPSTFATNVVLSDSIGSNLEYDRDSFELVDKAGNKVEGTCNVSFGSDGRSATISLGDLAGGDYYIRYKTKVKTSALEKLKDGETLSNVDNQVKWSWGSEDHRNTSDGGKKTPAETKYKMVVKSADGSSTNEKIKWTVKLNTGSIKADMSGYAFSDELGKGQNQQFLPSDGLTITTADGTTVTPNDLVFTDNQLSFTLPDDIGEQELSVTYYTTMLDQSSKDQVDNTAKVTTEHPGQGPDGEGTGSYKPSDEDVYITKDLVGEIDSQNYDGSASWVSTIDFGAMSKSTKPESIEFKDYFAGLPDGAMGRIDGPVTVKANIGSLIEGVDYTISTSQGDTGLWYPYLIDIKFKNTAAVRALIGTRDAKVTVSYKTLTSKADGAYPAGTYMNRSEIDTDSIRKTADASFTTTRNEGSETPAVAKRQADVSWDAERQAWVITWEVHINCSEPNAWTHVGVEDLKGEDVTVDDALPDGATYIDGSAQYWLFGNSGYATKGYYPELHPTVQTKSDGSCEFTLPTESAVNADGSWVGYVKLTYKTEVKQSKVPVNGSATFTNKAQASSGDYEFPQGTADAKIENKVLDKDGVQNEEGLVTYTINVNENAMTLNGGKEIVLEDVMGPTCQYAGDLQVTDGKTGLVLDADSWNRSFTSVTNGDGSLSTKMTLTLPDARWLKVTYKVKPVGEIGKEVTLENTCSLAGLTQKGSTSEKPFRVKEASSETSQTSYGISVTKYNVSMTTRLEGAEFTLYKVVSFDSADRPVLERVNLKQANPQTTSKANNCTIAFGSKEQSLEPDVLYCFKETKAPSGYEISQKDPVYFVLRGNDADEYDKVVAYAIAHKANPAQDRTSWDVTDEVAKISPASASPSVKKKISGAPAGYEMKAGAFTFQLEQVSAPEGAEANADQTKSNEADGSVLFDDLTFTKAGTYTFKLSETSVDTEKAPGVSKSDAVYTIMYNVVEKDGKLSVESKTVKQGDKVVASDDANIPFTNIYSASGNVAVDLKAKKELTGEGAELEEGEFEFKLEGDADASGEKVSQTKTNDAEGNIAFDKLTFDKVGTYKYTISEVVPEGAVDGVKDGVTYDRGVYHVTVGVEDNGKGGLKQTTTIEKDGAEVSNVQFNNTYEATGSATVKVQKTVNGEAPASDQAFDFKLTPIKDAPMPGGAESLTAETVGGDAVSFPELTYTLADAGKIYVYKISETTPATVGWTMAGDVTVTVKVGADQGDGTLGSATVTYSNPSADGSAALFDNGYEQASGEFQLALVKTVNGEVPFKGEKFEFSATAEGDNAKDAPEFENVTTGADGAATFKAAKLSDKDAGKTYTYRIHEVTDPQSGNGTWAKAADVIATVKVSGRSADNKLAAKVTYRSVDSHVEYANTAQFDNTFKPKKVMAQVRVKKATVNGKTDVKADKTYTFGLYKKGTDGQAEGKAIDTVSGQLGETLSFASDKLAYSEPGTYEYLIHEETHNGSKGWAAVADVPVTVTVTAKGGNGSDARDLKATVSYGEDGEVDHASFADTYTATGSATLKVNKLVNGGKDKAEGEEFEFVLKDSKGKELSRTKAAAGETVEFAPIVYTLADAGNEFKYTISETGHNSGRWFKAGDVTATVTVTDNGDGTLKTEASYSNDSKEGAAALFDNTYAAPAKAKLEVSKTINGAKEDAAKEKFAFELTAKDDAPMPKSAELTVDGTGTGSFGEISYSEPGTYEYAIHETSELGDGWTNAKDVTATVTVERDETAKALKVTKVEYSSATEDGSAAAFDNTYTVKGTEVSLKATKVLKGAALKEGEFEFQLKDASGKILQTAKNGKDGSVSFDPISYEASDLDGRGASRDFEYTISEVVPADAVDGVKDGITYDMTGHKVKVHVSDDGTSGQLEVTVTYDGDSQAPVFTNTYKPKEEKPHEDTPKGDTPKGGMPTTGDTTAMVVSVFAAAGLCALAGGLRLSRRKHD